MSWRAPFLTWSLRHNKILTTTSNNLTEELADKWDKLSERDAY